MGKRNAWPGVATIHFTAIRESEFNGVLAELGALLYGEIRTRQVQLIPSQPEPIAEPSERKAANA